MEETKIYFVTICIPIAAETEKEAFTIGHDIVSKYTSKLETLNKFGAVVEIETEEDIKDVEHTEEN